MRSSMLDEVDFTKEAANIGVFSNFLDARGLRGVATCPYVYSQFSSKRLLVMEKLNGVSLTDYAAIRSITSKDPEGVLVSALNTWFSSVVGCDTFHADVHAGNLLALSDGRVGFIDFGIVGSISPVTWKALEALASSLATADYETMARALATIGACDENVNYAAFSRDLESFFVELEQMNKQLVVTPDASGRIGVSASVEVDQTQLNRLFLNLVRIGERHGVRFPREFGLFLKQVLYFDRYTRILAPSLQVFTDDRINIRGLSREYGIN
jgi:aarF domain-containing kinase